LFRSLVIGGVLAALCCGALDSVLATATDPGGYPSILSFFVAFLVAAGVAGLGYALLAVGAKLLLPETVRSDAGAYSLSLGTFLVSFFTLSWVAGLNQLSALHDNPAKVAVVLAAVLPLSFLASAGSWQLVNRLPATPGRDRHVALAALLFAGGLSASTLAVVSMNVTGDGTPNLGSAPSDEPTLPSDAPIRRVVLLTVDTLRKDSLTAYNPDGAGTPHIDSLAKDSIFFENAFTSAPWTVPSFVSMFTGLPPDAHKINHNFPTMPGRFRTLAEFMRAAGYETAAIGNQPQLLRIGRGFETYRLGSDPVRAHEHTMAGRLLNRLTQREWTTEVITDAAIAWLDAHRRNDFFLWLHWLEPHSPYEPPKAYLPQSPLVEEMGPAFARGPSVHTGREIRTPSERDWLRALYASEVRYTDAAVGRVLKHLQELGLYDDSLIIFTADHGEEFWDHGRWEHGQSLYDELVATPLFIKLPGDSNAKTVEAPVSNAAVFSTVLDLCEVERPDDSLIVESLAPSWQGSNAAPAPVYLGAVEYFEPREGVVFDEFKYIVGMATGHEELYNLDSDPAEQESLIASHPAELERGRELIGRRGGGSPASAPEPDSVDGQGLSDDVRNQLRALGYIE
jgi:arylsulfatase A-like enzyme